MTIIMAVALKQVGIPAVRWSAHNRQFFTRIGYRRSKSGRRQRAFFYLGKDLKAAIGKAAALKSEWRGLRRKGGNLTVWPLGSAIAPSPEMAKLTPEDINAAIEKYHHDADVDAVEAGEAEQKPTLRIEQVRDQYLEYRKSKLGIGDGQGINEKSYNNEFRNLKNALAVVDQRMTINGLSYPEIERLRDGIFRRVGKGELAKRTANSYWGEVRRMLDWAHRQPNVTYRHPEDVNVLFKARFKNVTAVNIAEYDADQLKKLLETATDRQRLFIYLALNCGHYQVDIGNLRADEIIDYNGKTAIVRRRSKTAHQNDFESMHILWDETAKLLKAQMAKRNAHGLALLSEKGTPIYRVAPHCDIITDTYGVLQKRAGVKLPFKQFRKLGATAIQRIGGDEARRLYKAGTIDSGDKVYVREAWEKLTPHLMAWGKQLRADGVLK